jgi:hypothetical protein
MLVVKVAGVAYHRLFLPWSENSGAVDNADSLDVVV